MMIQPMSHMHEVRGLRLPSDDLVAADDPIASDSTPSASSPLVGAPPITSLGDGGVGDLSTHLFSIASLRSYRMRLI
jgi:hypothetical protein